VCACYDFTVSAVTWSVSSAKVLLSIIVVAMQKGGAVWGTVKSLLPQVKLAHLHFQMIVL